MTRVTSCAAEKILELRLDQVEIGGGTQSRAAINNEVVNDYAEKLDALPPAVVFHDGSHYWLAAGFHRYFGHKKAGRKTIACIVRTGTVRDAILFSVGENEEHGLRRTREDRRHICWMLLSDKEWKKWSDREIARQGKVSHWLVGEVRREIKEEEKARREKEKAEKEAAEERARKEAEEKAAAERARVKDGWVRPGQKKEEAPPPKTEGVTGCAASEEEEGQERAYTTKHGTTATMKTGGVNKGRDRNTVRAERDAGEKKKIEKQLARSIPKAVRQAKRLGWDEEAFIEECRKIWRSIPVVS